ncbi:MAG TPA: 2-amino-4-hydroxy-6-hydroxymethyldihydropteridine diphosphokinase [Allosphingosinicella sp.]|nr:2-amino-4-hydroxy-6-hydroxymethyldihydropteridine diphosphokinase [Allosphingosinicella sp.]
MALTSYAIALGSNRRHGRHGAPAETLRAAVAAIEEQGFDVEALSAVRATPALGPAGRAFANAAALVSASLDPPDLLKQLKATEEWFGRRPGRRWGPRVLDLDIILWSEGAWEGAGLVIPHPSFRTRRFVLEPLAEIAPGWRDPMTGLTVRQLAARQAARTPVDRHGRRA